MAINAVLECPFCMNFAYFNAVAWQNLPSPLGQPQFLSASLTILIQSYLSKGISRNGIYPGLRKVAIKHLLFLQYFSS